MCRDSIAELEIVPLLLQSLQLCYASPKFKIQCLITLAACIEGCGKVSFNNTVLLCEISYHSFCLGWMLVIIKSPE